MGETVQLTQEQLQELLDGAVAKAVAEVEAKRAATPLPSPTPTPAGKRKPGALTHFDPRTRQEYDPGQKAWLWRPDLVEVCPCGQEKYARTQEFIGGQSIEHAQHPVMAGDQVVQLAWQPIETLPEDLRHTEEKATHFRECNEAHVPEIVLAPNEVGQQERINVA